MYELLSVDSIAPDWEWVLAIITFSFYLLIIPIFVASSIYDRLVTFVSIELILPHPTETISIYDILEMFDNYNRILSC